MLMAGISQPQSAWVSTTSCPSAMEVRVTMIRMESAWDFHIGPLFNPSVAFLPHYRAQTSLGLVKSQQTQQGVWLGHHTDMPCPPPVPLATFPQPRPAHYWAVSLFLSCSLYCSALHFHLIIVGGVIRRLRCPGDREGDCILSCLPMLRIHHLTIHLSFSPGSRVTTGAPWSSQLFLLPEVSISISFPHWSFPD